MRRRITKKRIFAASSLSLVKNILSILLEFQEKNIRSILPEFSGGNTWRTCWRISSIFSSGPTLAHLTGALKALRKQNKTKPETERYCFPGHPVVWKNQQGLSPVTQLPSISSCGPRNPIKPSSVVTTHSVLETRVQYSSEQLPSCGNAL